MGVHVADDGIGIVLVDRLQLGPGLQHQAGGDLAASDRSYQLLQVRDLADIRCLIDQAPDMDREPSAIHIISFLTQQVEQLGVNHGDQEVERGIRIRHDQEQCCLPVPDGIQFQLIVSCDLSELLNIKDRQSCPARNEDRLSGLACNYLSRTF